MTDWKNTRNVLCIRADNMGDLIMTTPALRALKETIGCRITILTSKAGSLITPHLSDVDEVIVANVPWVKTEAPVTGSELTALAGTLRQKQFDAAIIFTVYSQSALPGAMLALQAGIPLRLAFARENPYQLLTHWLPDDEPYHRIRHQVERDLELVATVGAVPASDKLNLTFPALIHQSKARLRSLGVNPDKPYLILHPGVSEEKRMYPADQWIAAGKRLSADPGLPLLVTGAAAERGLAQGIASGIGDVAIPLAGDLSLEDFIALVSGASGVISVNTSTIHIAAATNTPVAVLYALTNPQHTPWRVKHELLPFSVPVALQSRNQVIRFVGEKLYSQLVPYPTAEEIRAAVKKMIS